MMKKMSFFFVLVVLGAAVGAGAGYAFRPSAGHAVVSEENHPAAAEVHTDFVKLNNQFVVPVVEEGRVASLVIMSLSLEVTTGATEAVYLKEPKLRDALLQVMFDHANVGGFNGVFTDGTNLTALRRALYETAHGILGEVVLDVLIADLSRQDAG